MHPGRLWQLRHFEPYCHEQLDLLDFGCADGLSLRTLPARRRIGVEVNPVAVEACKRRAAEANLQVEMFACLEEVPSESVDVVISNHCLEHVPRPLDAICQLRRILRKRGQCIIVTPFDDWRNRQYREWRSGDRDHHLYTWGPMNLGNLVAEGGLSCKSSQLVHSAWSVRFLPLRGVLGDRLFAWLCWMNSVIRHRREIICHAEKT